MWFAAPDSWDAEPEEPKKKDAGSEIVVEKKKAITKRALQKKEEEERKLAERMVRQQAHRRLRISPSFLPARCVPCSCRRCSTAVFS